MPRLIDKKALIDRVHGNHLMMTLTGHEYTDISHIIIDIFSVNITD